MKKLILASLLALLAIYIVPFVVYATASVLGALQAPDTAPAGQFLLGVLITKLGTAITFVVLFAAGGRVWLRRWPLYGLAWFVMFACSEVGDVVSGRTAAAEAVLGIASEAIYAPLSAFLVSKVLLPTPAAARPAMPTS